MLRLLIAAALLWASPAMAQEWIVDEEISTVGFVTEAFDINVEGQFPHWTARITLDPADLANASIEASITTSSATTFNNQMDEAMLTEEGLAPATHPLAHFVSIDIRAGETGYEAHGTLEIRGVEQPLVLPFQLTIDDDRAVATGEFLVTRTEFGIGNDGWGDTAAEVRVVLHVEAVRAN
jgi:polyisoprenoid-binding protein YceI